MIKAITAARMIMTVVVLLGKKEHRYHATYLPYTWRMSAELLVGKRWRQESDRLEVRCSGEVQDCGSDKSCCDCSLSKVVDHVVEGEEPQVLPPEQNSPDCSLWFMSTALPYQIRSSSLMREQFPREVSREYGDPTPQAMHEQHVDIHFASCPNQGDVRKMEHGLCTDHPAPSCCSACMGHALSS